MLLQTFVIGRSELKKLTDRLLDAVAALTNTSDSVASFIKAIGREHLSAIDSRERLELRAWIDAVYFTKFGFAHDEVDYVFETFPIWKDKSTETWGQFLEKELTIGFLGEAEQAVRSS